ncbi:MAG: DUF2203 domain-containing protein [Planctomycetaceae bacterium]
MQAPLEKQRLFSVDDANRMLPLIKRIVSDIVSVSEELDEHQFSLDVLGFGPLESSGNVSEAEDWDRRQQQIDAAEDRMDEYVTELAELGVELQDASIGEVDFPTQVDGEQACLCWRLGEPKVAFWHWEDAGFDLRQSLFDGVTSTDGLSPREMTDS